ncbi:MAG TPA: DUF192 domain-containing protein [bacterium]|nr:DUF192 domain-containing protein [bacterium]
MKKIKMSLLILIVMMFCAGCGGSAPGASYSASGMPVIDVRISNSAGADFTVKAEVATTVEQHAYGLMNRSSMPADSGMLFVFDSEDTLSFWMKDTLIPLDMIFADADKKIVDINRNAAPLSTTSFTAARPAKYVLEVNGGYCDRNGIGIGDMLSFSGY